MLGKEKIIRSSKGRLKLILITMILLSITLSGCGGNKVEENSFEKEKKEMITYHMAEKYKLSISKDSENFKELEKDFPYAGMKSIPMEKVEYDGATFYCYELKYSREIERRQFMVEKGYNLEKDYAKMTRIFQEFMTGENGVDGSTYRIRRVAPFKSDFGSMTLLSTAPPYNSFDVNFFPNNSFESNQWNNFSSTMAYNRAFQKEIETYYAFLEEHSDGPGISMSTGSALDAITFILDTKQLFDGDFKQAQNALISIDDYAWEHPEATPEDLQAYIKSVTNNHSFDWMTMSTGYGNGDAFSKSEADLKEQSELLRGVLTETELRIKPINRAGYYVFMAVRDNEVVPSGYDLDEIIHEDSLSLTETRKFVTTQEYRRGETNEYR